MEKKNLLLKLFDVNELLTSVKIENMSLLEKVKSLELDISIAREQINRSSTSKLDEMLHIQKSISNKTSLGFVENGSTTMVNSPKFVPATSSSLVLQTSIDVKINKKVALVSRRTRVDMSEFEPKKTNQSGCKKNHKPQWFCHFCGRAGHTRPNCFKLQVLKQSPKQKVLVSKAQDPVALIHELVKVLNLYTNGGADIRNNSNSKFASKKV